MERKYIVIAVVAVVIIASTLTALTVALAQSNNVGNPGGNFNVTNVWMPFIKRMPRFGKWFSWGIRGFEVVVSDEFKQKVINILQSDPDTATLLSQGYNVTLVKPIITATVAGDGSVTMRATKAVVVLCNGNGGRAVVYVDVEAGKVLAIYKFEAVVKESKVSTTIPSSSA